MRVRNIEGEIERLRGDDGVEFFHFTPSGENDAATEMIGSLCTLQGKEVIVAEMTQDEWDDYDRDGATSFEQRISRTLSRSDLRHIKLVRVVDNSPTNPGISFQDFRKASKPPTYFYSCSNGDLASRVVEEMEPSEFEAIGGTITVVGNLIVLNE